jgi:hypothetical protein
MKKNQRQSGKSKSDGPKFLQNAGLIILGVLVGFVPSFIMSERQAENQMRQFMLDRKINTLKEYSISFNQHIGSTLSNVQIAKSILLSCEPDGHVSEEAMYELSQRAPQILNDFYRLFGTLNAQKIMVNAIFGVESPLPSSKISYEKLLAIYQDTMKEFMEAKTEEEQIKLANSMLAKVEKKLLDAMKEENEQIYNLALTIHQNQ